MQHVSTKQVHNPSVPRHRRSDFKFWLIVGFRSNVEVVAALLRFVAHTSVLALERKSALDTPFNIMLLRAFQDWTFDAFGMFRYLISNKNDDRP